VSHSPTLDRDHGNDPAIEEVLAVQAVYTAPQEVIVAAKVRPAPGLTIVQLTRAMDGLDQTLRTALPEVADVFIDMTGYRLDTLPRGPAGTDGPHEQIHKQ
jgi:hypothetical protein